MLEQNKRGARNQSAKKIKNGTQYIKRKLRLLHTSIDFARAVRAQRFLHVAANLQKASYRRRVFSGAMEAGLLQAPGQLGGQLLLMNWGRKSHFKRIGPRESVGAHPCTCKSLLLQAASVFRGHGSRPNRAEGNLYVHGSRSGRAEGALNVQPTCLGVQRILCTVKLPRNSTY